LDWHSIGRRISSPSFFWLIWNLILIIAFDSDFGDQTFPFFSLGGGGLLIYGDVGAHRAIHIFLLFRCLLSPAGVAQEFAPIEVLVIEK